MDKRALLTGLLWDAVLPTVLFYACRAAGLDVLPALAAGGLAALVRVGVSPPSGTGWTASPPSWA